MWFGVHRGLVVVYKGVHIGDTIQATDGPMLERRGIAEEIQNDGFLVAKFPVGGAGGSIVSSLCGVFRSFFSPQYPLIFLQSEKFREIRPPPFMGVYLESLAC